jgi:hypothetical protein
MRSRSLAGTRKCRRAVGGVGKGPITNHQCHHSLDKGRFNTRKRVPWRLGALVHPETLVELRLSGVDRHPRVSWPRKHLETGFLPEMDEGSIVLDYTSPPGTSLEETDRMLREAEKTFAAVPEIQSYSRRTGTQMGFFITEPNCGDYLIQLKKDRQAQHHRSD